MINSISGQTTAADAVQLLGGTQAATGGGQSVPPVLSNVANLLGMSTSDLMSSLQSGSSLSDLATQKGVSRDDLLAAITQGLQADAPAGATGQSSDLSTLAAQIADQKGLHGHHHHGHHHSQSSGSSDLQQNVADLASSLGISSDALVAALQSGLASTGSSSGTGTGTGTGYGVSASLLQGLQVDQLA
jgi:hypothetical protein